ncbi:MAG: DUF262 domain-containing protein, partial [Myxococcota bacterium]|nr:DUF262 domain-containing protein [Myxococcota bacterium]
MSQIDVLSVEALLSRIAASAKERWVLPLAQRAFVWKETQISRLVDSLLQGFPVGALLISDAIGHHFELAGDRVAVHSHTRQVHLLDGQQRSLSLSAAFGGSGWLDPISGRRHQLWINLTDVYPQSLRDAFNPNHT